MRLLTFVARSWACWTGVWLLLWQAILFAQAPPPAAARNTRLKAELKQLLEPAGIDVGDDVVSHQSRPSIDLTVAWNTSPQLGAAPPTAVTAARSPHAILARRRHTVGGPVPRALDLSGRLLVTVIDAQSRLLAWSVIRDSRMVRAEEPGPDGVLQGRVVPVAVATSLVNVPDDPAAAEIRIWEPRVAEKGTSLVLLAILPAR